MKILIEAIPRSGSTVLMKALAKFFNCSSVGLDRPQPISSQYYFKQTKAKNIVVKCMASQFPSDCKFEDRLDIHTRFAKQFDVVICLGRKNKKEQVESFAHAVNTNKNPAEWHGNYIFNNNLTSNDYSEHSYRYEGHISDLKLLSTNIDSKIIWYEDLYSGDKGRVNHCLRHLPEEISFENLKKYIDPALKYRATSKIPI
jgi:hypothetical protein